MLVEMLAVFQARIHEHQLFHFLLGQDACSVEPNLTPVQKLGH